MLLHYSQLHSTKLLFNMLINNNGLSISCCMKTITCRVIHITMVIDYSTLHLHSATSAFKSISIKAHDMTSNVNVNQFL